MEQLWRRDFGDYSGDLLRHLFLTENNEIIAVGRWLSENGKQTSAGAADIVVTKLAEDGRVMQQKGFGGSDFDNLRFAQYDKMLGIIIHGTTVSKHGDFGIGEDLPYADFVAEIDENLTFQWVVQAKAGEHFVDGQIAPADGFVYVLGYHQSEVGTLGIAAPAGFLIQLDKNGNTVWKRSELYTGLWGGSLSILQNEDIVMAAGQQNQGTILILDKYGRETKRIQDLKYNANRIIPTEDGGFIIIATREIENIPQPAYASTILFDTELIAAKYTNDYEVEWRKTYDKHKDRVGLDYVFPLDNGKMIVESRF
ncbi:MAG: hypothetical protein ACYDEJ_06825 [Desulfitobacteriaceae bacterium]